MKIAINGELVEVGGGSGGVSMEQVTEAVNAMGATKQDALTPGDGLSLESDTLNVDNPNRGIMTQAEFDALPEAEKAKGTYFVDDGASCAGWEEYSTEETIIGRWIDGRPIYRKVFIATTPNGNGLLHNLPNIDTLVFVIGSLKGVNPNVEQGYIVPSNIFAFGLNENGIYAFPGQYDVKDKNGIFTIEYTKTTDPVPTQEVTA